MIEIWPLLWLIQVFLHEILYQQVQNQILRSFNERQDKHCPFSFSEKSYLTRVYQRDITIQIYFPSYNLNLMNLSREQSFTIFTAYFDNQFNLHALSRQFPNHTTRQLERQIKNQFSELILELESQLFKTRAINELLFYQFMNPFMLSQLIKFEQVLGEKQRIDLLNYYRSWMREKNIKIPQHRETVFPLPMQAQEAIYFSVRNYCNRKKLFSKEEAEKYDEIEFDQYLQDIEQVYGEEELNFLYQAYVRSKGNLSIMIADLQKNGKKLETSTIEFIVNNIKTLGLYNIYGSFVQMMGLECLEWDAFQKVYHQIYHTWDSGLNEKLMRIGIFNNTSLSEGAEFMKELILTYCSGFDNMGNKLPENEIYGSVEAETKKRKKNRSEPNLETKSKTKKPRIKGSTRQKNGIKK